MEKLDKNSRKPEKPNEKKKKKDEINILSFVPR